jgi:hypothetical protein
MKREAILFLCAICLLPVLGIIYYANSYLKQDAQTDNQNTPTITLTPTVTQTAAQSSILWNFNGENWIPTGSTPVCSKPLISQLPVESSKVTRVLYPGQIRGTDYKAHGGFRFDTNPDNKITVKLPIDANLWRGSRYIQDGEIQYMLDFIAPCGVLIRFDHLLTLDPEFMKVVNSDLPAPQKDDTRTYFFKVNTYYRAGTVIASEVGIRNPKNVTVDFGVYDLRQRNEISKNVTWAAQHSSKKETAYFGICWISELPEQESKAMFALQYGGVEGKKSDYCK